MSFLFNCPACHNQLEAEDEWDGMMSKCPICQKDIILHRPRKAANSSRHSGYDDFEQDDFEYATDDSKNRAKVWSVLKLSALAIIIGLIIYFGLTGSPKTVFWIFVLLVVFFLFKFAKVIPRKLPILCIIILAVMGFMIHRSTSPKERKMSYHEKRVAEEYERIKDKSRSLWEIAQSQGVIFSADCKILEKCPNNVTDLTVPTGVEEIAAKAFYGCTKLTTVNLGDVKKIGDNAFTGCTSLTGIDISGATIGEYAFFGCYGLEWVDLDNVESISNGAFKHCIRLKELRNMCSIKSIGEQAFANCYKLSSLNFTCDNIGNLAFTNCTSLKYLTAKGKFIGESAFAGCNALARVDLDVEKIEDSAFKDCRRINELYIHSAVSIGDYAFAGCSTLKTIYFSKNLKNIGNSTFANCTALTDVKTSNGLETIGDSAFAGCTALKAINIPGSLKSIGDSAFAGCTALKAINIPGSLKHISKSMFANCTALTDVQTSNGLETIGNFAFSGCTALPEFTIPNTVKKIGMDTFANCNEISYIVIPQGCQYRNDSFPSTASIRERGKYSIDDIAVVKALDFYQTLTREEQYALTRSYGVRFSKDGKEARLSDWKIKEKVLIIPEGVTKIDWGDSNIRRPREFKKRMVYNDLNVQYIILPESITFIGRGAFSYCRFLKFINLPNSILEIGEYAFKGCSGLKSLTLPNKLKVIKEGTFEGCYNIAHIEFPDSVKEIDKNNLGNGICSASIAEDCIVNKTVYKTVPPYGGDIKEAVIHRRTSGKTDKQKSLSFYDMSKEEQLAAARKAGLLFDNTGSIVTGVSKNIRNVQIPQGVVAIGDCAFAKAKMDTVTIPDGVKVIGIKAFENCENLGSITIPGSVTDIKEYAFYGCSYLQTVILSPGVKSIGEWSFYSCYNLKKIDIPDSVESIGRGAFYRCFALKSIKIPGKVKRIPSSMCHGCNNLESVIISEGVEYIDGKAFGVESTSNEKVQSLYIPDSVKVIGLGAFEIFCKRGLVVSVPTHIDNYDFIPPSAKVYPRLKSRKK